LDKGGESVDIRSASKNYDAVRALDNVTLKVAPREFVSLLGPSGSGKTTLLGILGGFIQPSSGSIHFGDRDVTFVPPHKRDIGVVFQNYALFPHMTVRRNVGFGLVTQGRPKAEIVRRVDQALALVRLETQAAKLPGQLSGGQQQRVAIARAIVVEPPLVLMDEPLSNLDAKLRLEMRAEIRRIHTMLGCSTIYVTHDQEEALSLADRILVMIDGQTRQIGTPEELYSRPAHADVAEFMGYRNQVRSPAEAAESGVTVTIGGAPVIGTPMAAIGARAVAAIRPDDLRPSTDGPIAATVDIAEYHGRDFYAVARGSDGTDLYFRSDRRVAAGEVVRRAAPPARILVYPA
jgi:putative spermidine/putrescine transport system ATP-binding protein